MIGGPNGSGKSTLLGYLSDRAAQDHFPLGFVQNPDAIQREIVASKRLYLGTWSIGTTSSEFSGFVAKHGLSSKILPRNIPTIASDAMVFRSARQLGYMIPVLCDFFRQRWVARGESFTFETVMSGADKIDVLREASDRGYRTYLYYICTDDVLINEERIKGRVKQGGHSVPRGTRW
jgi:predicted ABC-type ATPase